MSHSQFHRISSLYLDMHGLIFERLFRGQAHAAWHAPLHPLLGQVVSVHPTTALTLAIAQHPPWGSTLALA